MPTYSFICSSCQNAYEEFRWASEGFPPCCPSCGEAYGEGFQQNWMENRPGGWTYGEDRATTFGQQAEINEKRAGKEQLQKMAEADRAKRSGFHGKVGRNPE